MNATPMNINPVNAAQPQPAAGKQQDAAAADVPFSQVLSSEMAHSRRNSSEAKQGTDVDAADAAETVKTEAAGDATGDLLAPPVTENATTDPATLLGLAITPDQLKPAPARANGVDADQPADEDATTLRFQNSRKGRTTQTGQFSDLARDTQKIDPALSGKGNVQTSTAAMATAFSGQLAAARQGDAVKGEFMSDLMSNPAMRPASQATFETLHTLNEAASSKLAPTLGTTAWNQALGEKVVWMAAGAQQTATLTLNPQNMGPLQIVLNISNEQATASFFSAQPEVRQALEAAFPRLKEMMNEAGIQLEQATVSADTPRQDDPSGRQAQRVAPPFGGTGDGASAGPQTLHLPAQQSGRGLVDTFA
ncbi:MAG: flagellar hook-length control protein FliK [Gammaproteobacteria bacterium]|nr:flagellar hook-length control protein FliK [Gammaproteobacteria bacterium]